MVMGDSISTDKKKHAVKQEGVKRKRKKGKAVIANSCCMSEEEEREVAGMEQVERQREKRKKRMIKKRKRRQHEERLDPSSPFHRPMGIEQRSQARIRPDKIRETNRKQERESAEEGNALSLPCSLRSRDLVDQLITYSACFLASLPSHLEIRSHSQGERGENITDSPSGDEKIPDLQIQLWC